MKELKSIERIRLIESLLLGLDDNSPIVEIVENILQLCKEQQKQIGSLNYYMAVALGEENKQ